jgi:phosphoribosylanthranilate isomerase
MTPPPRTRVKICGITRIEDGVIAARWGADAIGLVFYPPSPRFVNLEQARQIVMALPPFITTVGLFVNAEPATVRAILDVVPLALLQFHDYELMGLQRHLKVLGIFCRLKYRDGKERYIADLPRFLGYARKVADRYLALKPFLGLLDTLEGKQEEIGYTF